VYTPSNETHAKLGRLVAARNIYAWRSNKLGSWLRSPARKREPILHTRYLVFQKIIGHRQFAHFGLQLFDPIISVVTNPRAIALKITIFQRFT
jgi:hypothetical protein